MSLGNKADVSSNDLLEYWEDDDATSVVALYLESFGNPLRFGRIARRVARKKPVLALKGGATSAGARAAASHTAALASSDVAVDALFRQAGVQRTRTLSEFLDAAALLSSQPLPLGDRVAILTNAGGLAILCADACAAEGLELPEPSPATREALRLVLPSEASLENPIDVLGSATADTFASVLPLLLADPAFDAVCVLFVRPIVATAADVVAAVDAAIEASGHDKPVVGVFLSAETGVEHERATRVTRFGSPEAAARAIGVAARRASWLRQPVGVVPELDDIDRDAARAIAAAALEDSDDVWLDARASRSLLEAYGVRLAPEALADTPDAAAHAAEVIGMPVVVKAATPGAHKTESGGVALDLRDGEAVRRAARRIGCPVLVQPMMGGAELLVGATQDPTFGPLVAIGLGGVQAELIGAVSFALAPLTDSDAAALLAEGPLGRLAQGFRGRPATGRRCARGPPPPPLGADRRSPRGRRARSEPDRGRRSRLLRDRPAGPPAATHAARSAQDLVAPEAPATSCVTADLSHHQHGHATALGDRRRRARRGRGMRPEPAATAHHDQIAARFLGVTEDRCRGLPLHEERRCGEIAGFRDRRLGNLRGRRRAVGRRARCLGSATSTSSCPFDERARRSASSNAAQASSPPSSATTMCRYPSL